MATYLDATGTQHLIQKMLLASHPVGTLWFDGGSGLSPAQLFGGNWERFAEGRTIFGTVNQPVNDNLAEIGYKNYGTYDTIDSQTLNVNDAVISFMYVDPNGGLHWQEPSNNYNLTYSTIFDRSLGTGVGNKPNKVNENSQKGIACRLFINKALPPYQLAVIWCRTPDD